MNTWEVWLDCGDRATYFCIVAPSVIQIGERQLQIGETKIEFKYERVISLRFLAPIRKIAQRTN